MTTLATASPTPSALTSRGLHPSAPEILPFAPSLEIRAFLLEREHGNVLVYSTGAVASNPEWLRRLGGASRRYLGHEHEASFAADIPDTPLFVHRGDARSVAEALRVRATFSRRHTLDDDFEVIPIPGHTPGATAYLWDSGEHRYLFTGDTIHLEGGEWRGAVLGSSDRAAYLESLHRLRELDFDVLVPWAASRGGPYLAPTDRDDTRRRIGEIIDRVWDGADG